jgi:hypothetical protein
LTLPVDKIAVVKIDLMIDNIVTLKVSLDSGTYRVIESKANDSLHDLAEAIIGAFDFELDHAFGFFDNIKNPYRSKEVYELFADLPDTIANEGAQGVQGVKISDVFTPKKKMAFLFDYGDEWIFVVECKGYSEALPAAVYPRLIEQVGEAPEQYPDYEEDEDEE